MALAQIDPDGRNLPAYGPAPNSLLVFTADMHFVAVQESRSPPSISNTVPFTNSFVTMNEMAFPSS